MVKDREARSVTLHGVIKSWTRLSDLKTTTTQTQLYSIRVAGLNPICLSNFLFPSVSSLDFSFSSDIKLFPILLLWSVPPLSPLTDSPDIKPYHPNHSPSLLLREISNACGQYFCQKQIFTTGINEHICTYIKKEYSWSKLKKKWNNERKLRW